MKTNDPRDEKCIANPLGFHKWVKSGKEKISKAHFVNILRCRWCGHHVGIEMKRTLRIDGSVAISERPFKMDLEVTIGLQVKNGNGDSMKHIDNATQYKAYA